MLLAFAFYPSQLLQISTVVKQLIAVKRAKGNERLRRAALKPGPPSQGIPRTYTSPAGLYHHACIFIYCTTDIAIFAFVFCIGWSVVRYMAMYLWEPTYESGGIMWLNVVDAIIYGLIIYQCTFIGLFTLKNHLPSSCSNYTSICIVNVETILDQLVYKTFRNLVVRGGSPPREFELWIA